MKDARNSRCACGSGARFKHCCGALPGSRVLSPTIAELDLLAINADDEGLKNGEAPDQRAFCNIMRMLSALGVDGVILAGVNTPLIVKRVHAANDKMFRTVDKQEGGIHLGLFMFRDLFARIYVPKGLGLFQVNIWDFIDLSDFQKAWLASQNPQLLKFEDQIYDLFDFGWGLFEFDHSRSVTEKAKELIYRAHTYLEAAAATATGAYDYRGTLQSALLGTELALKSGLANHGFDEETLRSRYGHSLSKAARSLGELERSFDVDRVLRAVTTFPDFVSSRYGGPSLSRIETGEIVMKAQYVASEVARAFTDRDFRKFNSITRLRVYP